MHIAKASFESTTPYSQSKNIDKLEHPMKPKETASDYEDRVWINRLHTDPKGFVVIPQTAFTNAIKMSARRLQLQIPGKGKTQYTKYFEAGIAALNDITLPVKASEVTRERLFVPSNGKPGSGQRVFKNFPRLDQWGGSMTFVVYDDIITQDVFRKVLDSAGLLVGIGRFRPENRGFYGRFRVTSLEWIEDGDEAIAGAA